MEELIVDDSEFDSFSWYRRHGCNPPRTDEEARVQETSASDSTDEPPLKRALTGAAFQLDDEEAFYKLAADDLAAKGKKPKKVSKGKGIEVDGNDDEDDDDENEV